MVPPLREQLQEYNLILEEKHCCSITQDRVIDENLKRQIKNRTNFEYL